MSFTYANLCSKILEISEKSFYRWKNKDHVILVNLLEKYFTKEDLEEFLKTGKIQKMEQLDIVESIISKICGKFFYQYYSAKEINRDFSFELFPLFENYVEKLKKEEIQKVDAEADEYLQKGYKQNEVEKFKKERATAARSRDYYSMSRFVGFLIELNIETNQKTNYIRTISKLDDLQFNLLINNYKKYLDIS
jgi:hypothetical protein